MTPQDPPKPSVLIVGAGCFGLATAYTLASSGYDKITVLEKDDVIPSRFSAGNDLNKIIRAEYADNFYTDLSISAIRKWQSDPLYRPHFHQTGFLNVTSENAPQATKNVVTNYLTSIRGHPAFEGQVEEVHGAEGIRRVAPAFTGSTAGWSGYFNKLAGYAHSADASRAVHDACVNLGVEFVRNGEVSELVYGTKSSRRVCIGVKTRGNKIYHADKVMLALGANVPGLIPQLGPQVTGRCWGVVHIQLTPEEALPLRGIPVTNVRDLAFFFEPDEATNKLKFCHMGGGFTNFALSPNGLSLPYGKLEDSQFVPLEDETYIRKLLQEVFPQFADRPLIDKHLCWFADTVDSDYIIDYVPDTNSSLIVLSGDSGHGFKMLPIFGGFVKEVLEQGSQKEAKWQWKDDTKLKSTGTWRGDTATQELSKLERAR
ncbi:FAD dependent oxidoreductase [Daldinia caldariorum]|uniref:FAD dependent oxidoreductase n=1 Tax=Daldinia caldariorum TaxID=326644 RepID=UPI0020073DE1|nr:FAD dependent oxidoreductase [Daldinia caldariorum]KAI1466951.1 FAD dependent oxidoreductase [Daldinia caldariorum]